MSDEFIDKLLKSRAEPPVCAGLERRILSAAALVTSGRGWVRELAGLFVLPYPAVVIPVILLAGLFFGLGIQETYTQTGVTGLLDIDGVWL